MATTVITGAGSGIGAAIRRRLEAQGDTVIGVDLKNAEVIADLSEPLDRRAAVDAVLERCDRTLDRLVTCAGIGSNVRPASRIAAVNYFGSVEVVVADRRRPRVDADAVLPRWRLPVLLRSGRVGARDRGLCRSRPVGDLGSIISSSVNVSPGLGKIQAQISSPYFSSAIPKT